MPLELLNPAFRPRPFRAAMFDFDGTLSLVREGWAGVMADVGAEALLDASPATRDAFEDEMLRLSGRPSIDQMRRLAEIVRAAGREAAAPEVYLDEFLRRLHTLTAGRKADLATGRVDPDAWTVPGSREMLTRLRDRGVELYLASGTERPHVIEELAMLKLDGFFGDRVFAPAGNLAAFAKRDVVALILKTHAIAGKDLIGFGDGAAETVEVKRVAGVAVGVASRPAGESGVMPVKRRILADLGADAIIPDYVPPGELLAGLFGG